MDKCPECGSKIVWIWGVDNRSGESNAFAECSKACGWASDHKTIGNALNSLQLELAAANERAEKAEAKLKRTQFLLAGRGAAMKEILRERAKGAANEQSDTPAI